MPDDTDDKKDATADYSNWKVREILRVLRYFDQLELEEKEQTELERRRAMTDEERYEEDKRLGKFDRKNDTKGAHMQRYYHRGAFYMDSDSLKEKDDIRHKAAKYARFATGEDKIRKDKLPEIMQVKKFGMSGYSTKYKGLKNEDTSDRSREYLPIKRQRGRNDDLDTHRYDKRR